MSLNEYKVTPENVAQKGVVAEPGTRLTGTAEQNKAVFDRLVREIVAASINSIIDALSGPGGAGEIGTTDSGLTVQGSLNAKAGAAAMELALEAKADKAETAGHIKAVTFDETTGVMTFTKQDNSTITVDTLLEKVVTNWAYDSSSQSLVLTLADGTTQSVSLSAFITETEFQDSDQIDFSVANHVVTATIKSGSITDTMLASALRNLLEGYVLSAEGWAKLAEAWATGEVGGEPASEPMASSNAKRFKDLAETWAVGTAEGQPVTPVSPGDPGTGNNAKYWAEKAAQTALSFRTFSGSSGDDGQDRTVILTAESGGRFDELKEGDVFFIWMAAAPAGAIRIKLKKTAADTGTDWIDLYGNYDDGAGSAILADQWQSGSVVGFVYREVKSGGVVQHREFLTINEQVAGKDQYGVTRLSSDLNSESEALAATPKAVKTADDRALAAYAVKTVTGLPAEISDGADGVPVKDLSVEIHAVQSKSGDPSPDNVRAITPKTAVTVKKTGKNILDLSTFTSKPSGSDTWSYEVEDGILTFSDLPEGKNFYWTFARWTLAGTYTIKNFAGVTIYAEVETWGQSSSNAIAVGSSRTVTVTAGQRFRISATSLPAGNTSVKIQMEAGESATEWEPYREESSQTISLGRDVSRGTLDVTTGTLTVTHAILRLKEGQVPDTNIIFAVQNSISDNRILILMSGTTKFNPPANDEMTDGFCCSHFKASTYQNAGTAGNIGFGKVNSTMYLGVGKTESGAASSAASLKSFLGDDNNQVYVSLPRTTPDVYQLTPEEVTTLLGENSIICDAGTVTVTYRRDPTLALEELEATLRAAIVAAGSTE